MSALTEVEIFSQMTTSFRLAIELCEDLASLPLKGPTYNRFRKEIRLIEGCCKQACTWREDTRWLNFALLMAEVHKRAGDWLRGIKNEDGSRTKIADGTLHPAFNHLAENMRAMLKLAEKTKTEATKRLGMILPEMQAAPTRTQGRPMQVLLPPGMNLSKGGILMPSGTALQ